MTSPLIPEDIFVSEPADDLWQVVRGVASEESSGDRLKLQASGATTSLPDADADATGYQSYFYFDSTPLGANGITQ